jgi:hypothetical protein
MNTQMQKSKKTLVLIIGFLLGGLPFYPVLAQETFVHPGGLHTLEDLVRMKTQVAAKAHPWIDAWEQLIKDPLAQHTYQAKPVRDMNNRQLLNKDAHAAYLNAIRWFISGDERHAACAVGIFNAYASVVDQIPSTGKTDIVGLGGIGISGMAMAAEIMRVYDGWEKADFERFKHMMETYFYPVCHDFLTHHNGACVDYYWANWDANNILALMAIGVLCDNAAIFNEGVTYFKEGVGTGSIKHAVTHVHDKGLGQWQESGRDQEHAQLGVGLLGYACQIAWNQGLDLFGYANNRLLAGAEYVAAYNQNRAVPFAFYTNCQPANHQWPAINGRGRLDDRPIWELLYNHYGVRQGLAAPYTQRMAELMRPEKGSTDHFGYGTLTFTRDAKASPYPPHPAPGKPASLNATAGSGRVLLSWETPPDHTANGYVLQRSTSMEEGFQPIATLSEQTGTRFTDTRVVDGVTYFYRVAGVNQAGRGAWSALSEGVKPQALTELPAPWRHAELSTSIKGGSQFAPVAGSTVVLTSYGSDVGGRSDQTAFCYQHLTGDATFTACIRDLRGKVGKTGLMMRASLDPAALCVALTLGEIGGRFVRMSCRVGGTSKGTSMGTSMGTSEGTSTLGNTYTWLPAWFRLQRKGDVFSAYESSDGVTWFLIGRTEIPMPSSYVVGFAGTTTEKGVALVTTFDHVTIE